MKTLAELKKMSFIPHHDCGVCGATVGWEVAQNKPNPYFNPSCGCGCSEGYYDTWRTAFEWYNTVFEKESNEAVQAAWNMEGGGVMADDRTCYGVTKCVLCEGNIYVYTHSDSLRFFCDKCLNDLREIINERRKPKVVEIGFNIPGSASPAEGGA